MLTNPNYISYTEEKTSVLPDCPSPFCLTRSLSLVNYCTRTHQLVFLPVRLSSFPLGFPPRCVFSTSWSRHKKEKIFYFPYFFPLFFFFFTRVSKIQKYMIFSWKKKSLLYSMVEFLLLLIHLLFSFCSLSVCSEFTGADSTAVKQLHLFFVICSLLV